MKFFGRLKIIFDVRPILFDVQTKIGREQKSGLFIPVSQNHSYFRAGLLKRLHKFFSAERYVVGGKYVSLQQLNEAKDKLHIDI